MKNNRLMNVKSLRFLGAALVLTFAGVFSGCNDDDPKKEQAPELITKVTLTFTTDGGPTVTATATDKDGEGVQPLTVDQPINLLKETEYTLAIELTNALDPLNPEDITAEVEEEGVDHQFFFGFSEAVFNSPELTGNIFDKLNPTRPLSDINYKDFDLNNRPIGLETGWETGAITTGAKTFTVLLKHQPEGVKSSTSNSEGGEVDVDITFTININ